MNKFLMENMTWIDFNNKIKNSICILPIGSTEQHGPHLPLSVDSIIAKEFSLKLAKEIDGIVMPVLSYGYKSQPLSGGGPLFPGTIDLNGKTLIDLTCDILEELIKDGAKKIFLLNAHFENEAFILEAIDLISNRYKDVTILESNWWDPMSQSAIDEVFSDVPFPGWASEHAAVTETSLMLYFAPHLVNMDKAVFENVKPLAYHKYPIEEDIVPKTGVLAPCKGSSKEKGEIIIKDSLKNLVLICNEVFK